MSIESYLESRVIENPAKHFKKELTAITAAGFFNSLLHKQPLKKEVAQLGLALLAPAKDYYQSDITMGSKEASQFRELIHPKIWEDPEYYALLVYFAGTEKAAYILQAWNRLPFAMYQNGYSRRSFRAPENETFLLLNQVNFLRAVINAPKTGYYGTDHKYYQLTLEDEIRFDNDIYNNSREFMVWSAAIDSGNSSVYQLMEDIIFNKEATGKVTRGIIKALLNSNQQQCWELVEKLLLSAQRQEGLRQMILEALDETSIGALRYMIGVIIEHKLTRFSSVVRAIDTWAGLGWETEKETTVRTIVGLAHQYLSQPESIPEAVKSKNNNEVYMALWVQGVLDVAKTAPYLHELMDKGTLEKKCLALQFVRQTGDPYLEMPLYFKALAEDNLQLLAFALVGMKPLLGANVASKFYIDNPDYPLLFDTIYGLTQKITEKEKNFQGKVFSWLTHKFEKEALYQCLIYLIGADPERLELLLQHFESYSINLRQSLTEQVLGKFYCYGFYALDHSKQNNKIPTDYQRKFAAQILKDRGEAMIASAINVFSRVAINEEELILFQELLKRKNATLRKNLLQLLLNATDTTISPAIGNMLHNGDVEQRAAALELMVELQQQKRIPEQISLWTTDYKEKKKISEREEKYLELLAPAPDKIVLSLENGYGQYDPKVITPYALPKPENNSVYKLITHKNKYGFTKPLTEIQKNLEQLVAIFNQHQNYEYEVEYWDDSREKVLLGNSFQIIRRNTDKYTAEEQFQNYPLYELWDEWYIASGLQPIDLFLLTHTENCSRKLFRDFLNDYVFYYKDYIPNPSKKHYYDWNHPFLNILKALIYKYPFAAKNDFLIGAATHLYSNLPKKLIDFEQPQDNNNYYTRQENGNGWQSQGFFDVFLTDIELNILTPTQVEQVWNLYRWRQFNGLPQNAPLNLPPLYLYCRAFENKIITKDELISGILHPKRIETLTNERKDARHYNDQLIKKFDFLSPILNTMRETFLDVELLRGDSSTPVTLLVQSFRKIYGSDRFSEILSGLGKGSLYKGYIYAYSTEELNKQQLFSTLLKRCYPRKDDTQEQFNTLVKKAKIAELRLVQAAIYAPQWQTFISSYLGWKGLDSAIWWMHAHTKSAGYQAVNAELESEVAKYSAVDLQDFNDGAVDKNWFESAYKQLGKAKWEMLYDSAKYVTDGNGHRRARLYADTLLGDLKIREVTAKVKDKRDQDYLRVYGLVPLSKANPEKDVLSRYEYIQQFKKESREFGSMKQASEGLAIRVALENLARNAGYPDPIRLTWAMETKQVQKILSKETQVTIEGILTGLIIDEEGKAELVTFKEDKQLKAIPAKIKKHPAILELTANRKVLREQFTRSRKGLEEAMVRGDEFLYAEIHNLFEHPVIVKHLEKLLFISTNGTIGFYEKGSLITADGEIIPLSEDQTLRIAHCTDLHQAGVWSAFQSYAFDHQLKQPFKQIFRELYVPTPDELETKSISRRYAGHQVHPKQTLALLKSRGWKVDYEEGLQKVFHKEGFQVKLYALADWFSPADVESPTLETIEFHSLKDYKNIPFESINPRLFSEVMRDIDLVVSVAHVGATDPEASHSSIAMRSVLLRETARLFKLDNVNITGSHALIKGTLADYSVHLGSAVVHQVPGKYLSILPVHSQHRGRIFLPFADDDPKSAEVISKVLLLARDQDIQDPTVLSQIDRK